jgi:hypothetical protein
MYISAVRVFREINVNHIIGGYSLELENRDIDEVMSIPNLTVIRSYYTKENNDLYLYFCIKYVRLGKDVYATSPNTIRYNKEVAMSFVSKFPRGFKSLPVDFRRDKDFVMKLLFNTSEFSDRNFIRFNLPMELDNDFDINKMCINGNKVERVNMIKKFDGILNIGFKFK